MKSFSVIFIFILLVFALQSCDNSRENGQNDPPTHSTEEPFGKPSTDREETESETSTPNSENTPQDPTYTPKPTPVYPNTPQGALKGAIHNWSQTQIENGVYLPKEKCNYEYVMDHPDESMTGFMGVTNYFFHDFNQDGMEECLFTFEVSQCDGGNALWYTEEFGFAIYTGVEDEIQVWEASNKNIQLIDNDDKAYTLYDNSGSSFSGMVVFDKVEDGQIILREMGWSEEAGRYPDRETFHTFNFARTENGIDLLLMESSEEREIE